MRLIRRFKLLLYICICILSGILLLLFFKYKNCCYILIYLRFFNFYSILYFIYYMYKKIFLCCVNFLKKFVFYN